PAVKTEMTQTKPTKTATITFAGFMRRGYRLARATGPSGHPGHGLDVPRRDSWYGCRNPLRDLERAMDLHLSGKVAIVTGASRGIGLAITRALVEEGAKVVAASRGSNAELAGLGATVRPVAVDLTSPESPRKVIDEAVAAFGGLDILVNNVGSVHPRVDGFLSVTDEDWAATLSSNFLSAVRMTRAALPHLLARGAGAIITVSSVNAFLPDPLVIDYSAAKAALTNFCKSL